MPFPSAEATMANPPAIIEIVSIKSKDAPLGSQLLEARNSVLGLLKEPKDIIKVETNIAKEVISMEVLKGIKISEGVAKLLKLNESLRNIKLGNDVVLDVNATGGSVKIEYKKEI